MMKTFSLLYLLFLASWTHPIRALLHPSSPCPSVFSYEGSEPESDRWYGEIVLNSREYLVGVRLNVHLDRRAYLMVSWLGEITTTDNKAFTILNLSQTIDTSYPLTTRIMVRFNTTSGSPKVLTIFLNGKQICPGEPPIQVNALNKNQNKNPSSVLKRPDPIFITDTIYNPSVTTNDDYYSEFFNISQQNAHKGNANKVHANTESSVVDNGYQKPSKTGSRPSNSQHNYNNGGSSNGDTGYANPSTNVQYVKPEGTNYNSQSETSSNGQNNVENYPKKKPSIPEYNQKPQQTYTENNYNTRPQSNVDEYVNQQSGFSNRPQSNTENTYNSNSRPSADSESSFSANKRPPNNNNYESTYNTNVKPQINYESNYNSRPQTNSESSYNSNSRPQTNSESNYNTNTRPQSNFESSYSSNSRPQTNSDSSYNSNTNSRPQTTIDNGYSTISSNIRPTGGSQQVYKPPNQSNKKPSSQNSGSGISDIAGFFNSEHIIEDGNTNQTVIITVIKHNAQDTSTTTEAYRTTTSPSRSKTTPKTNSDSNSNTNKGHPLNTNNNQKRPNENKKTNNQNSSAKKDRDNSECGKVLYNKAQPLVTNGQKTARGQWPWHAALYKTEGINLSYICGGSLIAPNFVVTAAHCVTKKPYDRPVDADTLVLYLGKYHQHQFSDEGGVQNKQVEKIYIYDTYNSSNYLGDIALLQLSSDVEYSMYVRPVCLWDVSAEPLQLSAVEGKDGTVTGWGYDENNRVTEELKMANMPVVSNEKCIRSYPQFFSQFTNELTYCAGFRNGTSVCNGDSGGGMVFQLSSTWYLRGIVSITVARDGLRICDTKHYVVFTDVAKYIQWIRPIISGRDN